MREAGYMLPQSKNTHELLEKLINTDAKELSEKLLKDIQPNE